MQKSWKWIRHFVSCSSLILELHHMISDWIPRKLLIFHKYGKVQIHVTFGSVRLPSLENWNFNYNESFVNSTGILEWNYSFFNCVFDFEKNCYCKINWNVYRIFEAERRSWRNCQLPPLRKKTSVGRLQLWRQPEQKNDCRAPGYPKTCLISQV